MSTPGEEFEVVVHAQTLASERALLVELRSVGGPLPPAEPGAHIDLHLPTPAGRLVRQYSLVDVTDPSRYLVCVQREDVGRGGSRYVHDALRVGHRLTVSAPRSTFSLTEGRHHTVLVGGGIGVTPLLAMAGRLSERGASFEVHCYGRGAIPLREYVETQPYAPAVRWHRSDEGESLRTAAPPWSIESDTAVYVCGPTGFIDAVREYAAGAGLAPERVYAERFVLDEPVEISGDAFTVVAASTGERMPVGEDETIAEVLQAHGYEVVLSCEQGICGSCLVGVLDGIPEHRDEVQTPAEHAANTQINLCVSRSRTPVLTLDI